MTFKIRIGSRAQVMHGTAKQTAGGLKKCNLKYNKHGKIVSKKASSSAKRAKNLQKAGYVTKKGVFGSFKKQKGGSKSSEEKHLEEIENDLLKMCSKISARRKKKVTKKKEKKLSEKNKELRKKVNKMVNNRIHHKIKNIVNDELDKMHQTMPTEQVNNRTYGMQNGNINNNNRNVYE